jgi:hypothetical protein
MKRVENRRNVIWFTFKKAALGDKDWERCFGISWRGSCVSCLVSSCSRHSWSSEKSIDWLWFDDYKNEFMKGGENLQHNCMVTKNSCFRRQTLREAGGLVPYWHFEPNLSSPVSVLSFRFWFVSRVECKLVNENTTICGSKCKPPRWWVVGKDSDWGTN